MFLTLIFIFFNNLGYGAFTDGTTNFINASTCTLRYKPVNPPIVFDYPLPDGYTKQNLSDVKYCGLEPGLESMDLES